MTTKLIKYKGETDNRGNIYKEDMYAVYDSDGFDFVGEIMPLKQAQGIIKEHSKNKKTMENIKENNKLIAEFMGWETENQDEESCTYETPYMVNISCMEDWEATVDDYTSWLLPEEMLFHNDWNWLMGVLKGIKGVDAKFQLKHLGAFASWEHRLKESLYMGIGNTYGTVVEFIKWYNENK